MDFQSKWILLVLCFLITACASNPSEPPSWAISPPADTDNTFYGVGSGLSLGHAKNSAKNDIAEKIQTSISSSIDISERKSGGRVSTTVDAEIKTQSAKINFRNSKLEASEKVGVQYYAQISVPRINVLDDIRQRKVVAAKKIRDLLKRAPSNTRLENFIAFNSEYEVSSLLVALALMEKGVDSNINIKDDLQLASRFEAEAKNVKQKMRVNIQSSPTLRAVNASLKNSFSSKNIKLTSKKSKADLVIILSSSEEKQEVYDTKMALLKMDIVLINKKGETVYQQAMQSSGASMSTFSKASELARIEAAKKIRDSELFKYIKMENL